MLFYGIYTNPDQALFCNSKDKLGERIIKAHKILKGAVSATPLILSIFGDDKQNCLKEAPKNT